MNAKTTQLTVLLLLAAVWTATAQRRGIRTCSCQVGSGLSQQGKLLGRVCYVAGVGSCKSFTYDGPLSPFARRRLGSSRFSSRPSRFNIAAVAATASPQQKRVAAEQARRQLEARRTYERELSAAGVTVRPGTPEAAVAKERRPDDKSAALGNKALAQILYLQSLLGRSGRR